MRILQPFRRRDFAVLWTGQAASMAGDGIFTVAIAFQILRLRNDATTLSLVLLAGSAGLVACVLAGGVVTDRFERRRVLIGADGVRLLAVSAMGLMAIAGVLHIWEAVVLMLLYGAGEAFFQPAFAALLPAIVPAPELVQANAVQHVLQPLAMRFAGPALGGVLVAASSPGWALIADGATFGLSMLCVLALRTRSRPVRGGERALRELAAGWAYVRSQPWLWATLGGAAVSLLAYWGPIQVLLPYVVRNHFGGDAGDYGAVLAATGIGSGIAGLAIAQIGLPRRAIAFMYASWGLGSFGLVGFAAAGALWQLEPIGLALGATETAGMIVWSTLMQTRVPPALLGRVTSLDFFVSIGLTPVSFALVGPLAAAIGARPTLLSAGVASAAGLLAFLPLALRPPSRQRADAT
jgi:transmembrane secretion effector